MSNIAFFNAHQSVGNVLAGIFVAISYGLIIYIYVFFVERLFKLKSKSQGDEQKWQKQNGQHIKIKNLSRRPKIKNIFKLLLSFIFFPFVILKNLWIDRKRKLFVKVLGSFLVVLIMMPIWGVGALGVGVIGSVGSGIIPQLREVKGNSMLPTLSDGEIINFRNNFGLMSLLYGYPKRGDIIVFFEEDKNVDYVKRIIGTPGDTLEIRNGYVFINGEPLGENYINSPRSTYGSEFLRDCQKIEIPEKKYFVLGDNRKQSEDSRMIGLISEENIRAFLPLSSQKKFENRWHVSAAVEDFEQPTLNQEKYYELLNNKRKGNGLKALKSNEKLETSTKKRAEMMLKSNDISYEAEKSNYGMERAMGDAGYYNVIKGEIFTVGYYNEEELLDHFLEFPDIKEFLYHREYQETGITALVGEIDGCPTQIIVQHFGGYVPPNYKKEDIESWREVLNRLREIQPSWESLKTYPAFYQKNKDDVDKITNIINQRIVNIEAIVRRMEANQWLTEEEKSYTVNDKALYEQQESLATKLNAKF